jgi:hypothetical protein
MTCIPKCCSDNIKFQGERDHDKKNNIHPGFQENNRIPACHRSDAGSEISRRESILVALKRYLAVYVG